jgi:hypothetical protein
MNETSSEKEKIRSVLKTIKSVDHPVITRCLHSSPGLPSFAEGSPHISPENLDTFLAGLRDDISLMSVEPAKKV